VTKTKRILDTSAKVETRKAEDGKRYIEGVIPYNSRSEEMWGFVEVIAPTAFNKTVSDRSNVYAFWAHDEGDILGATQSGTLSIDSRDDGLHFSVELRDTPDGIDHFEAIARGDVAGVSFGFIAEKETWDNTQEPALRTLTEVRLLEISPGVAFPAYPGAQSDAARRALYSEGAPEFRAKFKQANPEPVIEKPLAPTPEPTTSLESRQRAELDLLVAMYGIR
jgi:uncharacterized protein